MKPKLFSLFLALVASVGMLYAESGTCGKKLTWNLSDGVLTISGTGNMSDYSSSGRAPWYDFRKTIVQIVIGGATSIGDYAFYNCSSLTSVTIPNSMTSIGDKAFYACNSLISITIPQSVTSISNDAFRGCGITSVVWNAKNCVNGGEFGSQVESFVFGNEVESIPASCCSGMSKLTAINIPNSVTSIGDHAFSGCTSLTSITIPNSVTSIGNSAFRGCSNLTSVTIPNSVTSIGDYAFYNCRNLGKVIISDIAAWCSITFSNYDSNPLNNAKHLYLNDTEISDLIFPNNITKIGNYTFLNCSSLTSVTIPNSVTSIGLSAFNGCSGLTSITIPNSVTSIGRDAFTNCSGITSLVWNAKNCVYGDGEPFGSQVESVVFGDEVECIPASLCYDMGYLTSISIPNSVTNIGRWAFASCFRLSSVIIPNSVISIGEAAFWGCKSVTSVTIGNSVTSIGDIAFNGCSMTSVTIPNSVTSIGNNVFRGCTSLTTLFVKADIPPTLGSEVFSDNISCIYIPCGSLNAYRYAWSAYASIIQYQPANAQAISSDNAKGFVSHPQTICDSTISATPNIGYHFTQWSDGNMDNPRTIDPSSEQTYLAEFALNSYTITLESEDAEYGMLSGATSALHQSEIEISATANYGYHFVKWADNNTDNPRTIIITQDTTFTAIFAKNKYIITKIADKSQGSISGPSQAEYLDQVTIKAEPEYGFHFSQWSDGNKNNPRSFELTRDTTFIAEFAKNIYAITLNVDETQGAINGLSRAEYLDVVTLTATPKYGYHFTQWSDGIKDNPRTVELTSDTTFTAEFAKNIYQITLNADDKQGTIDGLSEAEYLDNVTLTANPNYGYHFTQWSDGVKDNPRTFELTRDTTFTAEFAPNQYTLSLQCNNEHGTVEGAGTFDYQAQAQISATPAYGYHFSSWGDGNTENPRTYTVTKDVTLTANFSPNTYQISVSCNSEQGRITGGGSYTYLSNRSIEAIPNYGYHFSKWSDGNIDNPRSIELRQDTAFVAIFAIDKSGTCGDNLQLTWQYDSSNQILTISGEGDLTNNKRYGVEATTEMRELIVEDGVGIIGTNAFANIKTLKSVSLGKDVRKLQERVFYNCYNLEAIYSYRRTPASALTNTFEEVDKYACTIYVMAGSEDMFRSATGWKDFYSIRAIGASETTVASEEVTVAPTETTAAVTWPAVENAATYELVIRDKNGNVVCTLIFNANGQLTEIAFAAPGRSQRSGQIAGFSFTVTGLDSGTGYDLTINAKDSEGEVINTTTQSFTTVSSVTTGVDATLNASPVRKHLIDGVLFILRDGKTYTVQGQQLK